MSEPESPLAHHFYTMALNNAWANGRLAEAYTSLGDEGFHAPRPSFFGSIGATANHLLLVDRFYVDAMERARTGRQPHRNPSAFFDTEDEVLPVSAAAAEQQQVDTTLARLTAELDDAALGTEVHIRRRHGTSVDSMKGILAHLFQHQIHHRGQIHGLLSAAGVAPPQLDEFFCRGDASARADFLRRSGLTEADLRL